MELERTPIISIRTGEAVKSVKELKQNIQDLKDRIVELRNAEKDCSKETLELQASQRELNAVNGLTKTSTDAVAGSYQDLLNQLKEARDEWKKIPQFIDGELNPAYTEATNRVRALTTQVSQMEQSIGDWHRNVGNYQSAFDGLAGGATKLSNGLTSVAGSFGIATGAGTPFGKAMDRLKSTVSILQSASGLLGMVKSVGSLTTATKANTTATATNTVAKGAETTATWTLKGAVDALKASLTMGLSVVIEWVTTGLSLLVPWLVSAKDASDELTESTYKTADAYKAFKDAYDNLKQEQSRRIDIMRAEGKSEKEIHEQTQKYYDEKIAKAKELKAQQERLAETSRNAMRAHEAESEGWKAAKKDAEDATKAVQDYRDEIAKLEDDKKFEQDLYNAKLRNPNANRGGSKSTGNAEADKALKEAREAQALLDSIRKNSMTEAEKINQTYKDAVEKLKGYLANGLITQEQYAEAESLLMDSRDEDLRNTYKKEYTDRYNNYKKGADLQRKEIDETMDLQEGLIATLKDTWDERLKLDQQKRTDNVNRLKEDKDVAMDILRNSLLDEQKEFYERFSEMSDEELKTLYFNMLNGVEEVEEPFKEALKTIVPNILSSESEDKSRLEQYVKDLMKAYEDAVKNEDVESAKVIRDRLLGDPPIASDEELTEACNDFIDRFAKKLEEAEKNKKPWVKFFKDYSDTVEELFKNVADAWDSILQLQVRNNHKSEEQAKKEFKWIKGLRVAEATMNTLQGVTAGIKKGAPWGYVEAAANLAAGIAQVHQILATDFNGSGGGLSTSAPTVPQESAYVPTVGLNTLDAMSDALGNNPQKVYVLESDITEAQNTQKVRVEESTF